MQKLATLISAIFTPLMMPTYGIALCFMLTILLFQPTGTRLTVLGVIFGLTFLIPVTMILLLHYMKILDKNLINRKERLIPYLVAIVCYFATIFYLVKVHSPMWMTAFIFGALGAIITVFAINFCWKISAHMTGCGGLVAILMSLQGYGYALFDILPLVCLSFLFAGVVGSSRVYLERHTLGQVLAGFVCGFVWVFGMGFFF